MSYVVIHQSKAISGQSSKFLCNTDIYGIMHQNTAISEQSSEVLGNTVELWCCASKRSNFRIEF